MTDSRETRAPATNAAHENALHVPTHDASAGVAPPVAPMSGVRLRRLAIGAAIANQDPQSGALYTVTAGFDATSTYAVVLSGLSAVEYVVGGWFQYLKPDGSFAYGRAIMDTATPS